MASVQVEKLRELLDIASDGIPLQDALACILGDIRIIASELDLDYGLANEDGYAFSKEVSHG